MSFEKQFRIFSYLTVFCGFLALWISGTFGFIGTALFVAIMFLAWAIEDTRWQASERVGTALIVFALPVFYLFWRFSLISLTGGTETVLPAILARLILSLTAIKLLQKKSDRDWMFLYLMAFFELLLAAGLSISIGYVATFAAFIFVTACTIVVFQIRKAGRSTFERSTARKKKPIDAKSSNLPLRRVVLASAGLIVLISIVAMPVFFLLPRVSGAGFGGSSGTVSSGFSESVELGGSGRIQENDSVVMRIRVENNEPDDIHWRGVALDTFDGRSWSRSRTAIKDPKTRNERDLIQVDTAKRQDGLTLQTVYLEPLDTAVIFGLYRMVGVQGNFPVLYRDAAGAITFQRTGDRVSYRVLSDTATPPADQLRQDRTPYPADLANYLQLPEGIDTRIDALARQVTERAASRFDAALAIEKYLQNDFGYTLEQKASGADPLSDFLFNVREGHCEYFATSMAIMLRTQGIAARVVNGFERGEYNETADVYVVRQRNAHSWVEVYFPATDSWVTFDPTPVAAQNNVGTLAGVSDRVRKYVEALETFWIQYFVAFDNQEQRSLFVSVRNGVSDYQSGISSAWNAVQSEVTDWWKRVRGDEGLQTSLASLGTGALIVVTGTALILLFVRLYRKVVKLKVWRSFWDRLFARQSRSAVEFYERLQRVLEGKGFLRLPDQTPLEFACGTGIAQAVSITERYNRVRFGTAELNQTEAEEIESLLKEISAD